MTTMLPGQFDIAALKHLEEQLALQLDQTAHEIEHMDCFDDEQRAEIYTILQALREDSQAHRHAVAAWAGQWVSDRKD